MGQRSSSRNLHWLSFMLNGFQALLCLGDKDNEQKGNGLAFMESALGVKAQVVRGKQKEARGRARDGTPSRGKALLVSAWTPSPASAFLCCNCILFPRYFTCFFSSPPKNPGRLVWLSPPYRVGHRGPQVKRYTFSQIARRWLSLDLNLNSFNGGRRINAFEQCAEEASWVSRGQQVDQTSQS